MYYRYNVTWKSLSDGRVWYNLLDSHLLMSETDIQYIKAEYEKLVDTTKVKVEKISIAFSYEVIEASEKNQIAFSYDFQDLDGDFSTVPRQYIPFAKVNDENLISNTLENICRRLTGNGFDSLVYNVKKVIK